MLYLGPIHRYGVFVRLIHAKSTSLMAKSCKGLATIPRHQQMDFSPIVVPVKIGAIVFLTVPICVDHIEFPQYVNKMLRLLVNHHILHAKIVHY